MSGSRAEILGRIRHAQAGRTADREGEYRSLPRAYRIDGDLDERSRLALFVDRLEDYQVRVYRCSSLEIPSTIAQVLAARSSKRVLVPTGLNREWLPRGVEFAPDLELTYGDLDRSDGVLTACTLGIAFTGSLVLCHGRAEGRRALTLVPDYHLCVVDADQVVETVPEALRRLAALSPRLVTTIAGPSATADIEMTRIRGVHGPRTLEVVLADQQRPSS